ncbi:hypothetical protein AVEN_97604-1 [Araneus ventricosus]|uniref:Uncharacterized protein n=1 Tax=Araneus ventricosus TaxID=182803 RepID=A0A4Y2UT86_ARAVE|nr:hypothetical protein AVEN_97604-1 [Araneus ventricosus]
MAVFFLLEMNRYFWLSRCHFFLLHEDVPSVPAADGLLITSLTAPLHKSQSPLEKLNASSVNQMLYTLQENYSNDPQHLCIEFFPSPAPCS